MFTIGAIARKFNISRTTLLYYEEKGLLAPIRRVPSNYRTYSIKDCEKLALIKTYRNAGISIDEIKALLDPLISEERTKILKAQYDALTHQIMELEAQKNQVSSLLGKKNLVRHLSKENWVELLASMGLGPVERMEWHKMFEEKMPDAHQKFLESLELDSKEINQIRQMSRDKKSE